MSEWIQSVLSSGHAGITALAAVFLLGVMSSIASFGCCVAVIGAVSGYAGTLGATGKTKAVITSSLFFLLGNVVVVSALGFAIGFVGEFVMASLGNYWRIAVGVALILFGVYMLDLLPFRIPELSVNFQNKGSGIVGAALFGFVVGSIMPLSTICCNPFFPVVVAASFAKGSTLWGGILLASYALGFGLILASAMLGIGLGLGKVSKALSKFSTVLKYAGGAALIVFGFYFLLR